MTALLEANCLNTKSVANLTADDIGNMSDAELAQVVQSVSDRFGETYRTEYMDRQTLTTMAFLARRCCQRESYTCR